MSILGLFQKRSSGAVARDRLQLILAHERAESGRPDLVIQLREEILAVIANEHRLRNRRRIEAADLAGETLITYPVPEQRIDLIREVLAPANVRFERRSAELTVAILQLVASRRGQAALPNWAIKNYVDYDYVLARPVGPQGLWSDLYVSVPNALGAKAYVGDFVAVIREQCARTLDGITLLS